jgi:hypothetical protein
MGGDLLQVGFAVIVGVKRFHSGKRLFKGHALVNDPLADTPPIGIPGATATGVTMTELTINRIGVRLWIEGAPGGENFQSCLDRWRRAESTEEYKGEQQEDPRGSQAMA